MPNQLHLLHLIFAKFISPPEFQNPLAVYDITVYLLFAYSFAGTMYSNLFNPQLEMNIANGFFVAFTGLGSKTIDFNISLSEV